MADTDSYRYNWIIISAYSYTSVISAAYYNK